MNSTKQNHLADTYISIFNSLLLFHSSQLFELKSSIASIISETKESPQVYLEPCQTSMNIFFCENS